jgi:hypothetical protein
METLPKAYKWKRYQKHINGNVTKSVKMEMLPKAETMKRYQKHKMETLPKA